jgi:hypothetical protein
VPKLIVPGETVSCPGLVPEPDSNTLRVESDAVDVNVSAPLDNPLAVGAKATVSVRLCPASSVSGAVKPPKLNPLPVAVAPEIVTLEPPELVTTTYCVWLLPTWMLPKLRLEGLGVR